MKKVLTLIILSVTFISCVYEQFEPFDPLTNIEKIDVDSELYNDLQIIANTKTEDSKIVCLAFIYPFNIYLYDEGGEVAESQIVSDNIEFVNLLGRMPSENAIGLSYPIAGTAQDGSSININSNLELKEAVEACIEVQLIIECDNILEENCIWKIHSLTDNDRYNESLLDFYSDGTGLFYDKGNAYRTSWVSLFIEESLHVNIHIEEDSEISQSWNFDWMATIIDENSIELFQDDQKYLIRKECDFVNSCDYVEFKECELEDTENVATFIFDNYVDCIVSFKEEVDPAELTLSFYETKDEAEQEVNALETSEYTNISNPQIIFVNIKNMATEASEIIKIVLVTESCEENQ